VRRLGVESAFGCVTRCVVRSVKLWDLRAIPAGSSKGGRGCLCSLQIEGGGVWGIDWMRRADGEWLGAVAGMYERAPRVLQHGFKVLRFARYSGVHMIRLAPDSCPAGGGMLQLIDSTQAIHGDGALVRDSPPSHDRTQASPRSLNPHRAGTGVRLLLAA
jgi:hypothetical protein